MEAYIIAAGLGSRLKPLTNNTPKCLLEIGSGVKILDTQIENLRKAGINDITIVTGNLGDKIEQYVGNGIRTLHNPFYAHCNQAGTLLYTARTWGDDDKLVFLADVLFDSSLVSKMVENPENFLIAVEKREGFDDQDDKVLYSGDKIVRVGKNRVGKDEANGEFIGITKIGRSTLPSFNEALEHVVRGDLDSYMYDAFQHMIDKEYKLALQEVTGPWIEIDYPEDLERARIDIYPKLNRGKQND